MTQPDQEWTRMLGWPGYRVDKHEINEKAKTLKLWVRRKSGHQKLVWGGCGQRVHDIREIYEREVRDLPWGEYRVTVVIELYRVNCPGCGVKAEKVELLPSKAPFSKRFEEAVGQACESAPVRRVARQFGLAVLLKAQRLAATKNEFLVLQKAAQYAHLSHILVQ